MASKKTVTFAVPCYNSESYMDNCIESLVACGDDIEIILVNDGSTDSTSEKAQVWQRNYPDVVRAIDQENRGHGGAVNTALEHASGLYFKVVDSDDWLDKAAMVHVMSYLRSQVSVDDACDMVVANYLYDKVHEGKHQTIDYANVFPVATRFGWEDVGTFHVGQYLLMHSVIYRTQLLRESGMRLPEHCFYVDNIFVYAPLPHVRSIYYLDVDMYHYFIGREDQSVNEKVMLSRIDQQLRITKIMIDEVDVGALDQPKLASYMYNYLTMMMCICSVFLRMEQTDENEAKRAEIWEYLRVKRPGMYAKIRGSGLNFSSNLPSPLGRAIALGGYHIAQKLFKFN